MNQDLVFAVGLALGTVIGMVALILWSGWRGRVVRRQREAETRADEAKRHALKSKSREFDSRKLNAWLRGDEPL